MKKITCVETVILLEDYPLAPSHSEETMRDEMSLGFNI
jgi:hypothetical protein